MNRWNEKNLTNEIVYYKIVSVLINKPWSAVEIIS